MPGKSRKRFEPSDRLLASFCRETDKALLFNELTRSSGDGVAAQLAVVCENLRDARGSVLSFRAWLAA
jgi:hypothetical protein